MASYLCIVVFLCGWAVLKTVVTVSLHPHHYQDLSSSPQFGVCKPKFTALKREYVVLIRYHFS